MINKNILCLMLVVTVALSGCSAFRSETQDFTITTDQPDARIYVNGDMAGQGTVSTRVKRNQNVQLMVTKDGYIPTQRTIGTHLNTTGILDIVGAVIWLIPIFGLLASGSKSLDQNNVSVVMVKA